MRWLFRPVTTLLLGPIVFELVRLYLQATTQGTADMQTAVRQVGQIYAAFTFPALILILAILLPVDLVLRRTGFGLATVLVSPILAIAAVSLLRDVVNEPHIQAWSSLSLAAAYGLVWGLTIRDPSTVKAA